MLSLNHKQLEVWKVASEILKEVYSISKKFPDEERYNLISQIRRAALSISNNIAEGAARYSKAEKKRFYEVSRSSLVEVDNCFEVALKLGYVSEKDVKDIIPLLESDLKMLTTMINNLT